MSWLTAVLMVGTCTAAALAGIAIGGAIIRCLEHREAILECARGSELAQQARVALAQAKVTRSAAERLDNDLRGALRV